MLYYKVKSKHDNIYRSDGSILVANELYTSKEIERFKIPAVAVEVVKVSKRDICFFFGARFENSEVCECDISAEDRKAKI